MHCKYVTVSHSCIEPTFLSRNSAIPTPIRWQMSEITSWYSVARFLNSTEIYTKWTNDHLTQTLDNPSIRCESFHFKPSLKWWTAVKNACAPFLEKRGLGVYYRRKVFKNLSVLLLALCETPVWLVEESVEVMQERDFFLHRNGHVILNRVQGSKN